MDFLSIGGIKDIISLVVSIPDTLNRPSYSAEIAFQVWYFMKKHYPNIDFVQKISMILIKMLKKMIMYFHTCFVRSLCDGTKEFNQTNGRNSTITNYSQFKWRFRIIAKTRTKIKCIIGLNKS